MPTIQVRIDDQTKNDSTTLFDKLGITMSEAINLFLRQAVMRGGMPFTLTVPVSARYGLVFIPKRHNFRFIFSNIYSATY